MIAIILAIISGAAMSIQGVLNTRLNEKIGLWEATTIVQGSAFVLSLIIMFFIGKGNMKGLVSVNKIYLLGGILGVIITFTVIKTVAGLGPTYGIATILVAQLVVAALIDACGLFETPKITFSLNEFIGVAVMIAGIIIFKWKFH